jgi:cytochrome c oxidase assembly factor CtaG
MSDPHAHMQSWSLPLLLLVVVAESIYLRGWISLRSAFPNLVASWRLAAFTAGLILVWIAVGSPLATLDHQSLTIHMTKHLVLMTVAAPLLLAGAPAFPFICGLPKLFIKSGRSLASVPWRWLERCLRNPVLCWLAGTTAVIGWHLPAAFQFGMRSQWVHLLEDATFLMAGLLFWWPIPQSSPNEPNSPRWWMALYLFLATLPCDILSAFLVFCNRLVYPIYLSRPRLLSLSPLQDQECAGALMWVWVTFAYLIPSVVITIQILSPAKAPSQSSVQSLQQGEVGRSVNGAEVL